MSQPRDRPVGMAPSVGEPISTQIIPGNRLRDAHSYSLCVKLVVVKLAFPSFSCHWTEKYELWVDALDGSQELVSGLSVPSPAGPPGLCPPPTLAAGISGSALLSSLVRPSPLLLPLLSKILASSLHLSLSCA